MKILRILKLTGIFISWCWKDIKENYQDIKSRWFFETNEEMVDILEKLEDKVAREEIDKKWETLRDSGLDDNLEKWLTKEV